MTRGKLLFLAAFSFLLIAGGLGWWQRGTLLAHWHVRELAGADEASRPVRAKALADLGEDAVGPLLTALAGGDEAASQNLEAGLRATIADWPTDDPRALRTMETLHAAFARSSTAGKTALLHVATAFANREDQPPLPANMARIFGDLITAAEPTDELRPAALGLAGALLERSPTGQWQSQCRALALKGFADARPATRMAAIQLVLREPLRKDIDLLGRVVPFLSDREASVRRVALIALGTNTEVVSEEQLLSLLHDADAENQRLCEVVLRSRGLTDTHIRLGRLISDDDPAVRLQVFPLLRDSADVDVDVWLRRLTLDQAPAVRAAAARLGSLDPSDDLRHRLGEMARTDPSPTVREIARFYVDRGTIRKAGR